MGIIKFNKNKVFYGKNISGGTKSNKAHPKFLSQDFVPNENPQGTYIEDFNIGTFYKDLDGYTRTSVSNLVTLQHNYIQEIDRVVNTSRYRYNNLIKSGLVPIVYLPAIVDKVITIHNINLFSEYKQYIIEQLKLKPDELIQFTSPVSLLRMNINDTNKFYTIFTLRSYLATKFDKDIRDCGYKLVMDMCRGGR